MTSRRPLIAGNWKMNLNHLEAIAHAQKVAHSIDVGVYERVDVAVLPPFVDIRSVQTLVDGDRLQIRYGAQDLSPQPAGAYTGDISGAMLAKLGCSYVVVGHSERRTFHHEDDAIVNAKVNAALNNGLIPIVCVGESLTVRAADGQIDHCARQLVAALEGVHADAVAGLVIAYEPIWAIGSGRTATPADAQQMCHALRSQLHALYGSRPAATIRLLYGGSMTAKNAGALLAGPDVDGGLIGGASLDASEFAAICRAAAASAAMAA